MLLNHEIFINENPTSSTNDFVREEKKAASKIDRLTISIALRDEKRECDINLLCIWDDKSPELIKFIYSTGIADHSPWKWFSLFYALLCAMLEI